MVNVRTFKKILQRTQSELKEIVSNYLIKKDYKVTEGDGFVYGEGDIPILLVAHLDIVHQQPPQKIYFDAEELVMWSPTGIGGDDRCGVYALMRLISKDYKPHVLFLEDEEVGCKGAHKCVKALEKPNVKFMIEIDRRGSDDCVFYDCDNKDFKEYIESFGFKTAWGSYTDICVLSKNWDIASVNLSSGYFNEHTEKEFINLNYLVRTLKRVVNILEDTDDRYFDYQPVVYKSYPLSNYKQQNIYNTDELDDYPINLDGCSYYKYGWYDKEHNWHWYN